MKVTAGQVFAWRMRRQFVDPRGDTGAVDVAGRLCGVQAQVASAAETAVGLRQATPRIGEVKRRLADRSLVKTWAMRGTLHLLRPAELGAFLSLVASARVWEKPAWQRTFGATPQEVGELAEAVPAILDGAALTRDELVTALVADQRFTGMEEQLRSGWGALLKPLAWQGALCHGPVRSGNVTFTSPARLIPGWDGLPEPEAAAPVAIAAYLGAYGPATPEVFDAWLTRGSLRRTVVRRWFAEMGERLTEVEVDGRPAYVLTEHAGELADSAPSRSVRLLGAFDQYVLGPGTTDTRMLPAEHRARVSRAGGWISPVVIVGGRIAGVWEATGEEIVVSLFPGAGEPPVEALESEAAHVPRVSGLDTVKVRTA
ncbi:winged helix DNA-binding domain-containing protein [Actinoallomurus sp. CA-142502]|uniref:winged helix DNA-binding domain-containing protein n=1 Tax=Actinoallomurus sp. CA-142502 TaxID=3239885 RepID=UPI003D94D3A4